MLVLSPWAPSRSHGIWEGKELQCESKRISILRKGHANCMGEAPEVFEVDDKGYLNILQEEPPEGLREQVELAVKHVELAP